MSINVKVTLTLQNSDFNTYFFQEQNYRTHMYCQQVAPALRSQELLENGVGGWGVDAHALAWATTWSSMWQEPRQLTTASKEHIHMFVQSPSQLLPCSDEEAC